MKDIFKFIFTFSGVENVINKTIAEKKRLSIILYIISNLIPFIFYIMFVIVGIAMSQGSSEWSNSTILIISLLVFFITSIALYFIIGGFFHIFFKLSGKNFSFKESTYYGMIFIFLFVSLGMLIFISFQLASYINGYLSHSFTPQIIISLSQIITSFFTIFIFLLIFTLLKSLNLSNKAIIILIVLIINMPFLLKDLFY